MFGRLVPPSVTVARVGPVAKRIGVTRLAELTGMDSIGIPVFQAVRPRSRSLSVSQGKGPTRASARASALMEALELHHAETLPPGHEATADALGVTGIWSQLLPAKDQKSAFDGTVVRPWLDAVDLLTGRPCPIPRDLVSMDFTRAVPDDIWPSSNGLAAGNSDGEALVAALCEIVERDAFARFLRDMPSARRRREFDAGQVNDRAVNWAGARIRRAGCSLRLWDLTDTPGLPVIAGAIIDGGEGPFQMPPALGAACHPDPARAIMAAITEAAQSRLTLIAGARDDISADDYLAPRQRTANFLLSSLTWQPAERAPATTHLASLTSQAALIDHLVMLCAGLGGAAVVACVLTRPGIDVPVTKIVVPGLADHDRLPKAFAARTAA